MKKGVILGYNRPMAKTTKADTKRLILLDSHAIIHRAYHALPDFSSSKGEPTGALYGLSNMLLKITTDLKPDYIIAAYDLPQKTFRHEAYEGYKATRMKADDALVAQIIRSRDVFNAFRIPIYDCPGFEADDILGTIVDKTKKDKNLEIIIATGDMDTLQLVDGGGIKIFTLKKGITDTVIYDREGVIKRYGFAPELLPDFKGLRGDPSDNIIGIKGIGEKTATTLITTFGTIENIYKALKKDDPRFSKIGITPRIIGLLKDGEEEAFFSKTLATIRRDAPIKFSLPEKTFRENIDKKEINDLFLELEFRSLRQRIETIFGDGVVVPRDAVEKKSEDIEDDELTKISIAYSLLNSEAGIADKDEIISYGKSKNFAEAKEKILSDIKKENLSYVYEDIELAIFPIVKAMGNYGVKVDKDYLKKLGKEYHSNLDKLEKSIWKSAGREFNINSPKQLGEILFDEMKIDQIGGSRASKKMKNTAGGARSTRESELEKLRDLHPIINDIFSYRELQKLLSTYVDVLPDLVGEDGRIHAKWNQIGAATGRFSSQDPNLQNIPIKSDLGKKIRYGFVAPKGYKLISFDYSQIELRVAALMSGDEYLTKVFEEGKDVHSAVASRVFRVAEKDVTHEMRRRAKVINFGILYGMGVSALQQNLGTSRAEAQEFYNNYFIQFPSIRGYLDGEIEFAKKHGYTETLFGRRRHFAGIKSSIPFIRAMAERMAINAPLQGTAADCIKIAIREADLALRNEKLIDKTHLILQVHDELVYEVEESVVKEAKVLIENTMKNVLPREFLKNKKPVPLEVHVASGDNWGELK